MYKQILIIYLAFFIEKNFHSDEKTTTTNKIGNKIIASKKESMRIVGLECNKIFNTTKRKLKSEYSKFQKWLPKDLQKYFQSKVTTLDPWELDNRDLCEEGGDPEKIRALLKKNYKFKTNFLPLKRDIFEEKADKEIQRTNGHDFFNSLAQEFHYAEFQDNVQAYNNHDEDEDHFEGLLVLKNYSETKKILEKIYYKKANKLEYEEDMQEISKQLPNTKKMVKNFLDNVSEKEASETLSEQQYDYSVLAKYEWNSKEIRKIEEKKSLYRRIFTQEYNDYHNGPCTIM